jgi:hypothetical protein
MLRAKNEQPVAEIVGGIGTSKSTRWCTAVSQEGHFNVCAAEDCNHQTTNQHGNGDWEGVVVRRGKKNVLSSALTR